VAVGASWIMHRIFCMIYFRSVIRRSSPSTSIHSGIYAQTFYAFIQFPLYYARVNLGSEDHREGGGFARVCGGSKRVYGEEADHVRGSKIKESEPLKLPDPLTTIHRPILVSCPTPATSKTESLFISPHE